MILLIVAFLFVPYQAWAAIAFDAASTGEGTTSTSHNHTFASSSTDIAFITLCMRETGGAVAAATAVTVGGSAATFLDARTQASNVMRVEVWYYLNPPTGATTVAVTADATTDRTLTGVLSYTGVAQTSTFNTVSTNQANSLNMDVDSIASAVGELGLLGGCARRGSAGDDTHGAPDATAPTSTERIDTAHTSATSGTVLVYEEAGASPTLNMRVDLTAGADAALQWAAVGVSIRAAAAASTSRPIPPIIMQ